MTKRIIRSVPQWIIGIIPKIIEKLKDLEVGIITDINSALVVCIIIEIAYIIRKDIITALNKTLVIGFLQDTGNPATRINDRVIYKTALGSSNECNSGSRTYENV
jgi:hypothetical protein